MRCSGKSLRSVGRFVGMCTCTGAVTRNRGLSPRRRGLIRIATIIRSVTYPLYEMGCKGTGNGRRRRRDTTLVRRFFTSSSLPGRFMSHISCVMDRRRAVAKVSNVSCRVVVRTSCLMGTSRDGFSKGGIEGVLRGMFGARAKGFLLRSVCRGELGTRRWGRGVGGSCR